MFATMSLNSDQNSALDPQLDIDQEQENTASPSSKDAQCGTGRLPGSKNKGVENFIEQKVDKQEFLILMKDKTSKNETEMMIR